MQRLSEVKRQTVTQIISYGLEKQNDYLKTYKKTKHPAALIMHRNNPSLFFTSAFDNMQKLPTLL